ncbi:hypothetical protein BFP76_13070 [Amylibacter kogurei]|uniref:Uncharacterized protein n=1 Tax=Paramylibacter kogurei TaxID=1889778 RepID=A0A2G5KAM1_9RHOB|nr:hypothetical protein BFP76_13070 [Amylibacter kogurei]
MVRRVGFSEPDKEARRKRGVYKNTANDPPKPQHENDEPQSSRLFTLIFLSVWLIGWSTAIYFVFNVIIRGEGGVFLYVWLIAALIGWCFVVFILFTLIFNKSKDIDPSGGNR